MFVVMFLDCQHRLLEYAEMFRGTITKAAIYPREVVKQTLQFNAAATILARIHPSRHCEPSEADKILTKQLTEALGLVDAQVLVAGFDTLSCTERGLILSTERLGS